MTPETIYLLSDEDEFGPTHYWCADPAPTDDHDPAEAVEYVRKDKVAPTQHLVLRTNEHPSGRAYDTAEFFAYDQWWKTDLVSERDLMMVQRMASNAGIELRDERSEKQ